MSMNVLGLDVGGANLKISDGARTLSVPFPLWKRPEELTSKLATLMRAFPETGAVAATMTGELADCFTTRAIGVNAILDAIQVAAAGREAAIWQSGGEFVTVDEARDLVPLVAAANWHALATWAGRMAPRGRALLIDVGSTTVDLAPIEDGLPMPQGRTDLERLACGELLYMGVRRTPICALTDVLPWQGRMIPVAREVFATTWDCALILGAVPEQPDRDDTANGRPATRAEAGVRLARMIGADAAELGGEALGAMARFVEQKQVDLLNAAMKDLVKGETFGPPEFLLQSGEGEYLVRQAVRGEMSLGTGVEIVSLTNILGEEHSHGACAFALSRLGAERL